MVRWTVGDLAGAAWHLCMQRNLQPWHSPFKMIRGQRCPKIPYRIFRSTAVGAGEFPAGAGGALDSVAAGAYGDKNSIFFEVF